MILARAGASDPTGQTLGKLRGRRTHRAQLRAGQDHPGERELKSTYGRKGVFPMVKKVRFNSGFFAGAAQVAAG